MKKKTLKILSYILVAVLASTMTWSIATLSDTSATGGQTKLEQLENLILACFIGEKDKTLMLDAAASAMIESLGDRWSYYIPADQWQSFTEQKNNAYVGIGVTVEMDSMARGAVITKITAGSPAEEAGLAHGDILIGAEDIRFANMDLDKISGYIKGKEGTKVNLIILRDEQELQIAVERRTIQTPVATAKMLEGNIGLVTIVNFNSNCSKESIAAIESLRAQGAEKLIFDVRFNPGGYAHEMVQLLDYLLPEGELFRTVDYSGQENVDYSKANCLKIPMAVIVNADSYSAAEFFAAALAEYDWAEVVGEQTCGKGYFQNTFQLSDGSAVALSVGKYFTPKGVCLVDVGGITPDFPVEVDEQTLYQIYAGTLDPMEDPQILAAIDALKAK